VTGGSVRRAVAVGGGTGLPKVLTCLLDLGFETSAVVTMADDGGSSGALRRELGMLPPGDARNCLVAMSDADAPLAQLFQYRFKGEGTLGGHSLGNLMIAALTDIEGGFPEGLDAAAAMLGSRGRVLPSTLEDVVLTARDVDGGLVVGQAAVATSPTPISWVAYTCACRPAAYPPALEALRAADVVVIGPGSLYTSILPNFLVDGMQEALAAVPGTVVYVCNVANQRGETIGMDAADHLIALQEHGLAGSVDVVLVHDSEGHPVGGDAEAVFAGPAVVDRMRERGVRVVSADLADPADPRHHDAVRLASALRGVV
jgi:uncharacterized cofD-like protein